MYFIQVISTLVKNTFYKIIQKKKNNSACQFRGVNILT